MSNQSLKILIIDDHDAVIGGTKEAIASNYPEADLQLAKNAQEATEKLNSFTYNLVITDLSIPEKTGVRPKPEVGIKLLKTMMDNYPNLNITVQSADARALIRLRLKIYEHEGGFTVVDKGESLKQMLAKVDWSLNGVNCTPKEMRTGLELKEEWLTLLELAFNESLKDKEIANRTMQLLAAAKSLVQKTPSQAQKEHLSQPEKITLRNHLLIEFLYYTGARVSEVARLTWRDIKSNRNGLGQVTLFGKGGKTRTVLLSESLYRDLLTTRTNQDPEAAVFASRKGSKPLQVRQIRKIVNDIAAEAGLDGHVSPHWLRHSHASHSLDRGAPPQLVQQTLGHQSLYTLTRYAHARPSDSSGLYLPK